MIMEIWSNISYMSQILLACYLFIIPAKKRKYPLLRVGISTVVLLLFSYLISLFHDTSNPSDLDLQFWMIYILSAIVFMAVTINGSFLESVYCGIFACGIQHIAFDMYVMLLLIIGEPDKLLMQIQKPKMLESVLAVLIYLLIYLGAYVFFVRNLVERGHYRVQKDAAFPLATMILLIWVISILEMSSLDGFAGACYNHMIYRIMDALCCFYVLWVQIHQKERMHLQRELDGIIAAARQQQLQYQMTSETIDSINRRCHDLKHQIHTLRHLTTEKGLQEYLDDIENDVMIYDTALMTGNKALDTVLMEKGLYCKEHGIQWSCMADGSKLEFMKLEDIYAVFGNALDNAVRAVMELKEEEKRVISVKILEQNRLLMIQIQNYYEGKLKFEQGLPLTTHKNMRNHGFGMKSIRHTVEKYNGIITIQAKEPIFMLQILIPISEK